MTAQLPPLITFEEAAQYVRASVKTVRRWEKKRLIKAFRCGRIVQIKSDSLLEHVAKFSK